MYVQLHESAARISVYTSSVPGSTPVSFVSPSARLKLKEAEKGSNDPIGRSANFSADNSTWVFFRLILLGTKPRFQQKITTLN